MSHKVASGPKVVSITGEPDKCAIDILQRMLISAKRGEICSIAVIALNSSGLPLDDYHTPNGPDQDYSLIGAVSCLLSELHDAMKNRRYPERDD